MTLFLPQEKIKVAWLLDPYIVPIQQLATFIGITTAARQAIPVAPLFHHQLKQC